MDKKYVRKNIVEENFSTEDKVDESIVENQVIQKSSQKLLMIRRRRKKKKILSF